MQRTTALQSRGRGVGVQTLILTLTLNLTLTAHHDGDGAVVGAQLDEGADGGGLLGAAGNGGAVGGAHDNRVLADVPDPRKVPFRQLREASSCNQGLGDRMFSGSRQELGLSSVPSADVADVC